jgi:type I restriction enzyme, S subunit
VTKFPIWPLAELVDEIQNGFACGENDVGGVIQLRMNNVDTKGNIVLDHPRRVPRADASVEKYALVPGDVMFNNTNSPELVGKSALFRGHSEPVVFSNHFTRLRVRPSALNPGYLARWLNMHWRRGRFAMLCNQWVNQASVRKESLLALELPVPPLPEQRRIADILDKADAVRRKRKEAIALTEELLRSAFLEMFGDPVTNPKGWPIRSFRELLACPLRNGLSPATGGLHKARVLTLSAITRGAWDPTAVKEGAFPVEPWPDVRVDARDLLICRGNGNVKLVGSGEFPVESDLSVVFPDTMIAARIDAQLLARDYLIALWRTPFVRHQLEASARTTNGTFKVNQGAVENIKLPVPPIPAQMRFGEVARSVGRLRERHRSSGYDDLFSSLVHRAFRGELTQRSAPLQKNQLNLFPATRNTPKPR